MDINHSSDGAPKRHNTSISQALGGTKRQKLMTPEKPSRRSIDAGEILDPDTPFSAPRPVPLFHASTPGETNSKAPKSNLSPSHFEAVVEKHKVSTFNDPIHGHIVMEGLCLRIIDTKEFQRLRELKQLGVCDFVFPGATHTRFSHSIGVAHFAEKVVLQLQRNQPELNITPEDLLCVKVAGLCHDLGHGPFSHVFDGVFMHRVRPHDKWRHEDWSVNIFQHLLKQNHIRLSDYGLSDIDQTFIEEIVRGTPQTERVGRSRKKFFLYDVVNNSRSGLDVDKLDYFQRDIRHTNVDASCTGFQRFVDFGRVLKAEPIFPTNGSATKQNQQAPRKGSFSHIFPAQQQEHAHSSSNVSSQPTQDTINGDNEDDDDRYEYMICYPEKMVYEALQLFALRFQMHKNVYTHKCVKKVEFMLVDALVEADPHIRIPGSVTATHPDGLYKMSECVEDASALSNLNDSVVYLIETSTKPELRRAQDILRRIRSRQFYAHLGRTLYTRGSRTDATSVDSIAAHMLRLAADLQDKWRRGVEMPDLHIFFNDANGERNGNAYETGGEGGFRDIDDENDDLLAEQQTISVHHSGDEPQMHDSEIFSQDSFAPYFLQQIQQQQQQRVHMGSSSQQFSRTTTSTSATSPALQQQQQQILAALLDISLTKDDIIVEKMHIHHGLKQEDPVSRLRFFSKPWSTSLTTNYDLNQEMIGRPSKTARFDTVTPRTFEEFAIRVFCRDTSKALLAQLAFQAWCRHSQHASPMLSQVE